VSIPIKNAPLMGGPDLDVFTSSGLFTFILRNEDLANFFDCVTKNSIHEKIFFYCGAFRFLNKTKHYVLLNVSYDFQFRKAAVTFLNFLI
jgi:hypothetical protein